MTFVAYLFVFALGLFVGSFLNCVIYRLSVEKSFLKGRSYCPYCKKNINFFDLIPLLSFFNLKGKCRYCSLKISWQYPLVEIATALIFVAILNYELPIINELSIVNFLNILYYWIIASIFIVVFVYDLKHFIIPDGAVISAIIVSLVSIFLNFFKDFYSLETLLYYFSSAIGASLFFLFFYLISKGKWMGFGDVKFAFAMGLFLGFPDTAIALFLSFLIGALVGVIIIAFKKKNIKSEIPFGPFLIVGSFSALFWGDQILTQYFMLFNIY